MMRMNRYLFRGKRKDGGEWVQGYLCPPTYPGFTGTHWHIAVETDSEFGFNGKIWVYRTIDPATIRQCTGLKDKNGNLIFEGDIVETKAKNRYWGSGFNSICVVTWEQGTWWVNDDEIKEVLAKWSVEIIGNIHDNPELLEVK